MRCTQRRTLEAHALGQLPGAEADDVRAHLQGCAACAAEASLLAAERRLFTQRAALPAPAPPPFAAVLARSRQGSAAGRDGSRARLWSALAAAAALLGIYAGSRGPAPARDEIGAPAIVAEPASRGETCEDLALLSANGVARAESDYGACLVATPAAAPGGEERECAVTCGGDEPHPGEALETRAEGERAP